MEWVSIAFGNAKYKMAANVASKMAAVITKISKITDFSLFLHPEVHYQGLDYLIITCITNDDENAGTEMKRHKEEGLKRRIADADDRKKINDQVNVMDTVTIGKEMVNEFERELLSEFYRPLKKRLLQWRQ